MTKVKIPQRVANYIESEKDNDWNRMGTLVHGHYYDSENPQWKPAHEWIANHFDEFLRAIVNGYEVLEEPVYYLRNRMTNHYLMRNKERGVFGECSDNEPSPNWQTQFAMDEIQHMYHIDSYEKINVQSEDKGE